MRIKAKTTGQIATGVLWREAECQRRQVSSAVSDEVETEQIQQQAESEEQVVVYTAVEIIGWFIFRSSAGTSISR